MHNMGAEPDCQHAIANVRRPCARYQGLRTAAVGETILTMTANKNDFQPARCGSRPAPAMRRRQFIGHSAAAAMLACFPASLTAMAREKAPGKLERRALGRTGDMLSVIGFGGIVVMNASPEEAAQRVRQAVEAGVNYFDVAPSYGDAEERLGPALAPFRKDVFLACKTAQRDGAAATAELDQSLRRLQTDHFDLYQLHAVTTSEEVEAIFSPGGAMEAFAAAKKAGKVRHLGFSAHSVEAATALMDRFAFDAILFPFNFGTWHAGQFGAQVLAKAHDQGMGLLALKAMAKGPWPKDAQRRFPKCWYEPLSEPAEARLGLRFTLSHPITSAIPPGDESLFQLALDLGKDLPPLTDAEALALKEQALRGEPLFRYPHAG
jgi:aryl-alcohol dehydrogenase-like predicted oxidoreductase